MSLTVENARRLGAIAGLVFVVLAVVSLFVAGTPPPADELGKITTYLADSRSGILASDFLLGLGFAFFLLFASALRSHLGAGGPTDARPGAAVLAGAATAAALIMAGAAVFNGAVFEAGVERDPNLSYALYFIANDLYTMVGFALAVFFAGAAAGIAMSGALPSPLAPIAAALAALNAISGVALFVKSGFFAIGGAYGYIVPILSLLWILVASVLMLRGERSTPGGTRPATEHQGQGG